MNIVVANDVAFVNGGAAKIALGGAKALAGRGHRVTLFTAVGPVADELQAIRGLENVCLDQMDVWSDPNRVRAATHSIWNQAAATRMAEVLAPLNPASTVVHLHSWTKALSSSVVRAARVRGFKVVLTLHDFMSVCPTGTLFHHGTGRACGLKPLSTPCIAARCDARSYAHKLWRVARQGVQSKIGWLPEAGGDFVTISSASTRIFRELLPPGARVHQVHNFIDVPHLDPVPVERNDAVVYIGRLSAEKGPTLLAECAERLGLRAIFVGDGELAPAVRARCPSAEITGWLTADEVRMQLRRARVLVLPSVWFELQGLVVAEAAAMGVPAIVPDDSGAVEWVIEGTTGLSFHTGDVDDLSRQIMRVMDDPMLAARMGSAACEKFWSAPPTIDRHVQRLERVYSSILANERAA
jgi:glycosyltransferase involved in cell wall biosynthesis